MMNKDEAVVDKLPHKRTQKRNSSWPRTLGAFHEAKVLAIFRCPTCRCDHYGISAEDAAASVAATNALLESLNDAEAVELYGTRTASTARFTYCFFCKSPAHLMLELSKEEPYSEPSPIPIIVEHFDTRE